MSLFKSGNPTLSLAKFETAAASHSGEVMTARGALNKFGFLFLMVMGTAFYSWKEFNQGGNVIPLLLIGMIGGLLVAVTIIFKNEWAPYLAPAYGLLEGLFLGAISAFFNYAFKDKAPDLIVNTVGLTFGTAIAMYILFKTRVIKVTQRFKAILFTAMVGVVIFRIISYLLGAFHVIDISFLSNGSTFGIVFSLVVVVIASMSLVNCFDTIEQGEATGAPKYMEWYSAFSLLVIIVWLYLEILRLLAMISGRK